MDGSSSTSSSRASGGRPFLEQLANDRYCRALGAFKSRTAVAATHWDVMVPCCTAAICAKTLGI